VKPQDVGCSCGGSLTVLDRAHIAVRVDLAIYSIEVLLRAAYKLTDRCYVFLDRRDGYAVAFIVGKFPGDDVTDCAGALANELIDQQVRDQLERRFAPIRTLITAQAFAEGNLLAPDQDNADYVQDPQGIGKPR
jgi:His-Xaa-Ser system protein HxsD